MLYISDIPILKNIINFFNIKKLFTESEEDEIQLMMVNLMDHFIETDPLRYSSPNFHSNIKISSFSHMESTQTFATKAVFLALFSGNFDDQF